MSDDMYVSYLEKKLEISQLYSAIENNIKNYFNKHRIYEPLDINLNENPTVDDLSIKMNPLVEDKFLEFIDDFEEEFGLKRVRITRFERIFTKGKIQEVGERNVTYSFKAK